MATAKDRPDEDLSGLYYSIVSGKLYKDDRRVDWVHSTGYMLIRLGGRFYHQHRVIWRLVTGSWPDYDVDHVDRNKGHNWWLNLRPATRSENAQNKPVHKNNKLQIKGVRRISGSSYDARIMVDGNAIYLGVFATVEEAIAARKAAELEYHPYARR